MNSKREHRICENSCKIFYFKSSWITNVGASDARAYIVPFVVTPNGSFSSPCELVAGNTSTAADHVDRSAEEAMSTRIPSDSRSGELYLMRERERERELEREREGEHCVD